MPAALAVVMALSGSPGEAAAAAARDVAAVPPTVRVYTRYLSFYAIPEKDWPQWEKVTAFWVNSLSREADLGVPRKVAPGLYAVNLLDYGWDPKTWEKLLDVPEPFFHATIAVEEKVDTVRDWPGGEYDGTYYPPGRYTFRERKKVKRAAAAPWIDAKDAAALIAATQSQVPIVRADWFLFVSGIQADRKGVGYYDWLGLGLKAKDFQALLGADEEVAKKVKREIRGIVARSGVTLNNRTLARYGAASGGWWVSYDFKKSVDRSNVIRFLDKDVDPPDGDASEQYGVLPNGLFAFWLQNDKGERQDTAPDFIASDSTASGNDRRVHIGLSCVRCHVEGLRPIDDWARRVYRGDAFRGLISLNDPDYKRLVRLRQLYLTDLNRWLRRDAGDYADVVMGLTGLKTSELARAFGRAWDQYAEADLGLTDVARETGYTEAQVVASLKFYGAKLPPLDPVLAGLIAVEGPVPIRREHFDEVFPLLMTLLRGYKP